MKRIFALILAALMLLSFAACGNDGAAQTTAENPTTIIPTADPDDEVPTTEVPTETTAPQEEAADPLMGYYSGTTYNNDFIGIQCKLDENWTVATEEELAQLNGLTADILSDEALAEQLRNSGVVQAFYAVADDGLVVMNIVLENLGLLYGTVLDEERYVELSIDQLAAALESAGLADITTEADTITFAGQEHAGIRVHGTMSGIHFYELLICVKVDSYMCVITMASYYEDITDNLAALYSPIA